MANQNSILDKIIQSKQMEEATQFNPTEVVSNLLRNLSTKEREIITKRFGLFGKPKETLEQIGKQYQITRERIRQIEVGTIKKIKEFPEFSIQIEPTEHNVMHLLENYGGVLEKKPQISKIFTYPKPKQINRQATLFFFAT